MFVNDAKRILLVSYTSWAFFTLAALTLAPDVIYLATGLDTNPHVWSVLQLGAVIAGLIGRLVLQPPAGRWRRRIIIGLVVLLSVGFAGRAMAQATGAQTMRILVPHVIAWEGEHRCRDDRSLHCAYRDIVGVPTLCFGETHGVRMGDRATDAECRAKLQRRLTDDYRDGVHRHFTPETRAHRLTPHRDAAYVSLAYNVGIRGAGRSTATRRLNRGDIAGGCTALGWWNKAGGRVVRGLVNRRKVEVAMCLRGT